MAVSALTVSAFAKGDDVVFIKTADKKWAGAAKEATVITAEGDTLAGKLKSISMAGSVIKTFRLQNDAGEKVKYDASTANYFKIKLNKMAKAELFVESAGSSIKSAVNTDYEELYNRTHAVWTSVQEPEDDDRWFLQLLNPLFANTIQVYECPDLVSVTSGEQSSFSFSKKPTLLEEYWVVKNGKTVHAKEKKYEKKGFAALFSDCPELINEYKEKDIEWDDFPTHIMKYDQYMSKKTAMK